MPAMIDPDVMDGREISEAEADEWATAICDRCGHLCRDHDDGECPAICPTCHNQPDHDSIYEPPNPCPACRRT